MKIVPITDNASQIISATLGGQSCRVVLYQRRTGLFMDLYRDDVAIVGGAICLDRVPVLRAAYHPFDGDLAFLDMQGTTDPLFDPATPGLGSRFVLVYLEAADLAAFT